MARRGLSSSSPDPWIVALALVVAADGSLCAQSTHLSRLESAAPAFVIDAVAALAFSAWDGAWLVPAAAGSLTGLAAGLERDGFSSLVVATGLARFRAGPVWSLDIGQVWIDDLFDEALLEVAPELANLSTRATMIGLDAAIPLTGGIWASAGGRYELDYLLGDRTNAWGARVGLSARGRTIGAVTAYERRFADGPLEPGPGMLRIAVSLESRGVHMGVGGRVGRLWNAEPPQTALGLAGGVTIAQLVVFQGSVGIERGPYVSGWSGYGSLGLGLRLMPVGVDVRYAGVGGGEGNPLSASLDWTAPGSRDAH